MHCADNSKKFALLVEGKDDEHFVCHLNAKLNLNLPLNILTRTGIEDVLKVISTEIKVSGRKAVGIIVDANDNLDDRWKKISEILNAVNIDTPSSPPIDGTIIESKNRNPRIGIWLMPDNKSSGELEDFVIQMIPDDDDIWPLAQIYINSIPKTSRKFKRQKRRRAELYAWLAARKIPSRIGWTISSGDLNVDGKLTQSFVYWLVKLFN